jgi:murein DD-endopeptidase MepM/ murein hydrolase activator NlpD
MFNTINSFASYKYTLKHLSRLTLGLILLGLFASYTPQIDGLSIKPAVVKADLAPEIVATKAPITFTLPHIGYISTSFSNYHPAVDIAAGLGFPVRAVASGTVTSQGYNFFGLGLAVEINHEYGYKSTYGHLGKTYVKAGQTVEQGDLIGEVGLTGKTSGPHTHFELTQNNQYIDPMTVLPNLPNIQTAWGDTSENALSLVPQKTTPESKSH